jgi:hypothetical protein
MNSQFQPRPLLLLILASWINRHQGQEVGRTAGDVACRERLGGILRYYYLQAA